MKIEAASIFMSWTEDLSYFTYTRTITDGYVDKTSSTVSFSGLLVPKVSTADRAFAEAGIDWTGTGTLYTKSDVSLSNGDDLVDVDTTSKWTVLDYIDLSTISNVKKYIIKRKTE